ncbi:protein Hook homolog 3 isoform X1 [Ricinus communis]|uniref:protein Hook homolog 3 isoform X1 n=2 Tax=Ricinus communis TaxID=3988 RepID=UPI00201AD822|nr:protein Hook homolog 3 isoform X1 [Ricinus communis]XP_015582876.2 protein Hook homolog 3 isoform X1 [Ricinus communis]
MDLKVSGNESLIARIQQLEHERDELHKDIEQLCMQQAGPSYLAVATKMHFQRTAGLEQEIESLKKKLAACTRDNLNLQEELSEAYRIKSQLADLHNAEVAKNKEAEKQLKFFQGCVASAFAERDNSIMEAEKAKEKEELMSQKFNEFQKRLEELTSDCLEQKRQNEALQIDLAKQEEQNESLKKVANKFYEIRQHSLEGFEDASWEDKCTWLLHDSKEMWSYNDASTSNYISALEEELEQVRKSADNLQSKLRVGLEIENHLKKQVRELEKKQIQLDKMVMNGIAGLRHYHSEHRGHIMNLLNEGKLHMKSTMDMLEEKIGETYGSKEQNLRPSQRVIDLEENECRDVHISNDIGSALISEEVKHGLHDSGDNEEENSSEALAQALQEKVAALLLLSQQEERHLLERNVNAVLQKKMEELQRNLLQVTNEKVKALVELAQLKQAYQQLHEKISHGIQEGNLSIDKVERRHFTHDKDGRLRNLLKRTYLKRWMGTSGIGVNEEEAHLNNEGNFSSRTHSSIDFARMKIENATLKESMESMEHLTSSIHRLRCALLKVKESAACEGTCVGVLEALHDIVSEAKLLKTAFGSSLPISWSAEAVDTSTGGSTHNEPGDLDEDSSYEKMDSVSAAGFEMVELLILAAQILEAYSTKQGLRDAS